ncbi:hypothetical protein [Xanthomonas fragariae]|uniref:hypothetical protein n=1 Tax=Xanthomonas fragariae TaxID=48664 RepID=UPI0022AA313A|nr:hypothetical protein [Xanthomonas fragariae]WAT14760.1 hypothetical protein OZ429_17745 [Xanthomonas fragariae]
MSTDIKWISPSISNKTHLNGQPLQFYMMAAYIIGAMALGMLVRNLFFHISSFDWSFYACIGFGAYIGVLFCLLLFKNRLK